MSNHYQIELEQHPIELYKLLKIANLVSGGGEAKVLISNGNVILNGELETQKRKKVYSGDIVEFNGDLVELVCDAEPTETVTRVLKTEEEKLALKVQANKKSDTKKKTNKNKADKKFNQKPSRSKNTSSNQTKHSDTPVSDNINNGQRRRINFD